MTKHRFAAAVLLSLLAAGCGRGGADKGQPSEQQRSDLDSIAAKVDNEQSVALPDDSLTVNDSEANAALSRVAPGNGAAAGNGAAVAPSPAPVPADGNAARPMASNASRTAPR